MVNEFIKSIELSRALFEPNFELRCSVFAFAWRKGKLLAVGRNQNKTHTLNLRNPIYINGRAHELKNICAELSLYIKLKNKTNIPFNKITIINVRIDRNLQVKMACPCNSCRSLLQYHRPKRLYYTNDSGRFVSYY